MGPMAVSRFDEDCLTVNIWTPTADPDALLPVLVWFHGGAYLSGAASAEWYDGAALAERGDIVVVTVGFRIGVLGYLSVSATHGVESGSANRGLLDQRLALEWVQENIRGFGGDPSRVTVAGQSAGAHSILALHALPGSRHLFQRAILQSTPFDLRAASPDAAEHVAGIFSSVAGVARGDLDALRALPLSRILAAQQQTLAQTMRPGSALPPFQLVVDGDVLTADPIATAETDLLGDVEVLLGNTADEMHAFLAFDDGLWAADGETLLARLRTSPTPEDADRLSAYFALVPDLAPAAAFSAMLADQTTVTGTRELAEARATAGRPTFAYWFAWQSRALGGRLGACHCLELPFVFGNFDGWAAAPMLEGVGREAFERKAADVQDAWISFIVAGDPARRSASGWLPYELPSRMTFEFGDSARPVEDPAGARRARDTIA